MKYPTNPDLNPEFGPLLGFKTHDEEIAHMAVMYSLRIMHQAERLCTPHAMRKKDLAAALGVTAAFVTQLNTGDKLINPRLIARLEKHFGMRLRAEFEPVGSDYDRQVHDIDVGSIRPEAKVIPIGRPNYNRPIQSFKSAYQ